MKSTGMLDTNRIGMFHDQEAQQLQHEYIRQQFKHKEKP